MVVGDDDAEAEVPDIDGAAVGDAVRCGQRGVGVRGDAGRALADSDRSGIGDGAVQDDGDAIPTGSVADRNRACVGHRVAVVAVDARTVGPGRDGRVVLDRVVVVHEDAGGVVAGGDCSVIGDGISVAQLDRRQAVIDDGRAGLHGQREIVAGGVGIAIGAG